MLLPSFCMDCVRPPVVVEPWLLFGKSMGDDWLSGWLVGRTGCKYKGGAAVHRPDPTVSAPGVVLWCGLKLGQWVCWLWSLPQVQSKITCSFCPAWGHPAWATNLSAVACYLCSRPFLKKLSLNNCYCCYLWFSCSTYPLTLFLYFCSYFFVFQWSLPYPSPAPNNALP